MRLFGKVLTSIDVERRLLLPHDCSPTLPKFDHGNGIMLQVKDDVGKLWNFRCTKPSGAVEKLVIVSGWIQFVVSKELRSGDMIALYKDDDRDSYEIKVKRKKANAVNAVSSVYNNESY